jgi:hypothetical protein
VSQPILLGEVSDVDVAVPVVPGLGPVAGTLVSAPDSPPPSRCQGAGGSAIPTPWADAKTTRLEQRLPEVIEALAGRAAADRAHTEEAALARAAEETAREAEAAIERAHAVEGFFAKELDRQARAWERWRLLTDYCDRLETHIDAADPEAAQTESARAWLAWARAHTATVDPFKQLPGMPGVPHDRAAISSGEIPPGTIADVSAARQPIIPGSSRIWESGRRFHSNG